MYVVDGMGDLFEADRKATKGGYDPWQLMEMALEAHGKNGPCVGLCFGSYSSAKISSFTIMGAISRCDFQGIRHWENILSEDPNICQGLMKRTGVFGKYTRLSNALKDHSKQLCYVSCDRHIVQKR
jgi:hypothetical protein